MTDLSLCIIILALFSSLCTVLVACVPQPIARYSLSNPRRALRFAIFLRINVFIIVAR